ncbi:hypothetical protein EJ04DRAFT_355173 [Polyplosphaeria fusca]|uniref:Uncharacterized protein n=1 Tax=Polyplosphaeria fusca TaxID=682080 RepID=A0A9P4R9I5_9PLEO|nr:hypothetical protein EJ04DRAFT_355173 [Polyplosphaeria fusca]
MPRPQEENEMPLQNMPMPEMVSPDRPPQLNGTVCGCRCGCGCDGDLGGEGNCNEDRASVRTMETLVASEEVSDDEEESPPSSDGPEQHIQDGFSIQQTQPWGHASFREIRARFGGYLHSAHSSERMDVMELPGLRLAQASFMEDYDDLAHSMKNEPSSDVHSVVSSDARSVRCISPGPCLGAWVEDPGLKEYHFSSRPLRLTPQRQFCRGLVASHLVLVDDVMHGDGVEVCFGG